jgi:hypothetical protein
VGTGPKTVRPGQQFFAAKAEQAEEIARECDDQLAREAWLATAKIWRRLAENADKEFNR